MLGQRPPRSAEAYAKAQRAEIEAATAAIRRLWRRVTPDLDRSYSAVEGQLSAVVTTAQSRLAAGALDYVPAVLAETGQSVTTFAQVNASPLVGFAGDGRPIEGLLRHGVVRTKEAIGAGQSVGVALLDSNKWLSHAVQTALSDTGRQGESLAMGVRSVGGYVRMLNPPSCSRCAILAGAWYRKNEGFKRHPGCDCRHIPVAESMSGDMLVSPEAYFNSLPTAAELDERYPDLTVAMRREAGILSQEDIFTRAGAEAIREGAYIDRVVNARRGMNVSQSGRLQADRFGLYTTTEARKALGIRGGGRGRPYVRLMPESISSLAGGNRDRYLDLLRQHGYLR